MKPVQLPAVAMPAVPGASAAARRRRTTLLCLLLLAPLAQAAPLGRLFLTPERRAVLERQRQLNIQEKAQETIEVANLHVNGVVRRSGGKATIWVNGRPQQQDETVTGVTAHPSAREVDRIEIRVGEERPASLRVSEKLNRATQETSDGLLGGTVKVNISNEEPRRR